MNEFGETQGIDSALVKVAVELVNISSFGAPPTSRFLAHSQDVLQSAGSAAGGLEEYIELANGCVCCSVKTGLVQALEGMLTRRDKFDYILIETTGALPLLLLNLTRSHRAPSSSARTRRAGKSGSRSRGPLDRC